jgi:hypothetical protein
LLQGLVTVGLSRKAALRISSSAGVEEIALDSNL